MLKMNFNSNKDAALCKYAIGFEVLPIIDFDFQKF